MLNSLTFAEVREVRNVKNQRLLATAVLLSAALASSVASAASALAMGVGLGLPYGNLGVNFDIRVTRDFHFTEGIGSGYSDTGYAVGGRYYFYDLSDNMRARFTALYGDYGGLKYRTTDKAGRAVNKSGEDFESLALGLGFTWMNSGSTRLSNDGAGFEFDIFYVDSSYVKSRARELEREGYLINTVGTDYIGVAFGYRMTID